MANLYIVATPIGNLEDISFRAIKVLKTVEIVFCEDTRVSQKIFHNFEIPIKKLISFNKDNERDKISLILGFLDSAKDIALISDAGTPLISDPGFLLIQEIFQKTEHKVIPIPGPSSLTAFLSVSPIDCSRFVFEGFLPHGPKQRRRVLKKLFEELNSSDYAIVFFESPHRIIKTLEDIKNIFGEETQTFITRELTKKFEQFYFGNILEIQDQLETQFPDKVQGEFVLAIKCLPGAESQERISSSQ